MSFFIISTSVEAAPTSIKGLNIKTGTGMTVAGTVGGPQASFGYTDNVLLSPTLSGNLVLPDSVVINEITDSAVKIKSKANRKEVPGTAVQQAASPAAVIQRQPSVHEKLISRRQTHEAVNFSDPEKEEGKEQKGFRFLKGLRQRWDKYWGDKKENKRLLDGADYGTSISAVRKGKPLEGVLIGMDGKHAILHSEKGGKPAIKKIKKSSLSEISLQASRPGLGLKNEGSRKARMNRRADYFRSLDRDVWAEISGDVKTELKEYAKEEDKQAYLRKVGAEIVARIQAERGVREIGFHYNLHGGMAEGYVTGGGIRAGRGDIALQYTPHGDMAYKVYLFRSSNVNLFDVLNESNPNLVSPRMGNVLNIFEADSDYMRNAFKEGGATKPTAISIDFEEEWLARKGNIGIPYSTYLAPPVEPFAGRSGKRIGLKRRLTKNEETLLAMRYIEAAVLASK